MDRPRALVLTGDLGMGHHVATQVVADSLEGLGWAAEVQDCMALLGALNAKTGTWVFRQLTARPGLYDAIHFAHFRTGSVLASSMDRAATNRLVPALARRLAAQPAEVVVSNFATGASALAQLPAELQGKPRPATVALCTDVSPHSLWVREGIDLFLVTSSAAAAAVRRYAPRAPIAVVPAPVRPAFQHAPSQPEARAALGVPGDASCVLVMGGGWGIGPLAETAEVLADEGVVVLAVAGHNDQLARLLRQVARRQPRVLPFGFTNEVPLLMSAADLVLTTAGATTCREARVIGRPLMLLDVMPGHGRDNIQHELELGQADVCDPDPARLIECVLAALKRSVPPAPPRPVDHFEHHLADALAMVGIVPGAPTRHASPARRLTRAPVPHA